jgi:FkbM family methyltransferase
MTVLVESRHGVMECLEGDSIISRALMLYGEWAQLELDVIARMVQPGDTVLDVGAFIGTHTLAFAHMVGTGGCVHSFEPREPIRRILVSNVERNNLADYVRVHPCALGSSTSEVNVLAVDAQTEQNFGGLAIEEFVADGLSLTETIAIRPLDDFTFERLDFIKIDAEGMEADVIFGGEQTLAKHRPILFAECNDLANGSRTMQSCIDMGYVIYGVLSAAFNVDNFKHLSDNIFWSASEASLLAIPNEKLTAFVDQGSLTEFAHIDSVDALNLLLLHKPQYVHEVLASSSAAAVLGTGFSSPLATKKQVEIVEGQSAFSELQRHCSMLAGALQNSEKKAQGLIAAVSNLEEEILLLEKDGDVYKRAHDNLTRYRHTSLLYLWERLTGRCGANPLP